LRESEWLSFDEIVLRDLMLSFGKKNLGLGRMFAH
jgi:hypothetical protein